jgi:hypothetical protein
MVLIKMRGTAVEAARCDLAKPISPAPGSISGMTEITEITLHSGERHRVAGDAKLVEQLILDAARGSLLQFAWLTDAQTTEPLGINPAHVLTLRAVNSTGQPAVSPSADAPR